MALPDFNAPKITAPETHIPRFVSVGVLTQIMRPTQINHAPVLSTFVENNAIRATALLESLLATLASREAVVSTASSDIETI